MVIVLTVMNGRTTNNIASHYVVWARTSNVRWFL